MTVPDARSRAGRGADPTSLAIAVEDYDLALARLTWVETCTCVCIPEQRAAARWHASELAAAQKRLAELRTPPCAEQRSAS